MTIKNAHWYFLEKFNKLESNTYRELTPVQIDEYLNDAQIKFISNVTNNKVEGTTKYSKDLATLLVKSPTTIQPVIVPTLTGSTYEMKSSQLAFKCLYPVSFEITAAKPTCTSKKIPVFIKEHDDKAFESQSTRKSSFIWNRCRGYIGRSDTSLGSTQYDNFSLYLESDGDFTITNVIPTYYKFPRQVCYGGYNDIEGNAKTETQFEFADDAVYHIIDIAIELASIAIDNPVEPKAYQTKLNN